MIVVRIFKFIGKLVLACVILLVLAVSAVFLFRNKPLAPPETAADISDVETYLAALCKQGAPPGLSLLVVKDGAIKYSEGFGLADGPNKIAATSQTIYKWWSMTKIFTATAILQLHEQQLLNIDDPVVNYLPYFKVKYPSNNSEIVSIRHLLNHSSGLPDNMPEVVAWMHLENQPALDQSALAEKVFPKYAKLKFEPGYKGVYSNVGYMMLGAIIETVSGQSYEDYVIEYLLKPIGANLTNFQYTSEMLPDAAVGSHPLISLESILLPFLYDIDDFLRESKNGRLWFNRFLADSNPPTGLIGPTADLARFMMAYLNNGELDGARILSKESVAMMTYQGHVKSGKSSQSSNPFRGLGWGVYKDKDELVYLTHGGGGPGFGSSMRLYPDQGLGIAVVANDTTYDREAILDLVAGLEW